MANSIASFNLGDQVATMASGLRNALFQMESSMGGASGPGMKLLILLVAIAAAWHIIEGMIDNKKNIIASLMKVLIHFCIVASLLTGWSSGGLGLTGNGVTVQSFFKDDIPGLIDKVKFSFTDSQGTISDIEAKTAATKVIEVYISAAMQLVMADAIKMEEEEKSPEKKERVFTSILDYSVYALDTMFKARMPVSQSTDYSENKDSWIATQIKNMIQWLVVKALLLVAAFFVLMAGAGFIYMWLSADIFMAIGLTLGPILVPFLLIEPLSFLFNNWLKFMIQSSLLKIVVYIMAAATLTIISHISYYMNNLANPNESMVFIALSAVLFAAISRQLMDRTDNIASSLAGGGANAGGSSIIGAMVGGAAGMASKAIGGKHFARTVKTKDENGKEETRTEKQSLGGMALRSVGSLAGSAVSGAANAARQALNPGMQPGGEGLSGGKARGVNESTRNKIKAARAKNNR